MKKRFSYITYFILIVTSFILSFQNCNCQTEYVGNWEGVFMNDFKVIIFFEINEDDHFKGNIKMFSNDNLIQDDKITGIILKNDQCEFNIPDKETYFKGSFNENITELSGEFIFPDGSKHVLNVGRKSNDANLEVNSIENFKLIKEKKITVPELHEDLFFLFSKLKEYHPQLYTYSSKDSINTLFKRLIGKINSELTLEDFYLLATQLTAAVKCSHTGIRFPETYQSSINNFGNFFPLKLFFTNGKVYYLSGHSNMSFQIKPGSELISINDIPISEIISQIFYFIPSEGNNSTTKYNEINNNFNSLFYLLDDSEEFKVTFRTGGSYESFTLQSCKFSQLKMNYEFNEIDKPVYFKYLNNETLGIIKIPSFAIQDMDYYLQQLDSIYSELIKNKIQNIIIDLRDNKGGHPIFAAQLLSYLTNHDFIYFKLNEDITEFKPLYKPMHPNRLKFEGNIYVFVNGGCLSTTGHLISLLKFHTNAVFIGEEPGSTFQCNDFSIQLTLPISGIELNVPRTTFETSVSGFTLNEPFPIDYEINYTADEIINRKDVYLEIVQTIIKNNSEKK